MHLTQSPEGTIPALDVIEVDEKYKKLAQHLLGNVFIAENEEALQNSNGFVVLEKHGKYVKGKYSLQVEVLDCLKEKKSAGQKTWKNWQKKFMRSKSIVNELK